MPNVGKVIDFAAALAKKRVAAPKASPTSQEALLKSLKPGDKVMIKPQYTLGEEMVPGGVSPTNMDRILSQDMFPRETEPANVELVVGEVRKRISDLYGPQGLKFFNMAYETNRSGGEKPTMSVFRGLEYMENKLGIIEYDPTWTGPMKGRRP
jgi:hypothetical protein